MTIEIRPVNLHFGAEIAGIDLNKTVERPTIDAISEAIDRYAVLIFHDQHLDDTQLRDFARNFGALEVGRAAARGDRRRLDSLGNRLWHTDASYMPVPVVLGMLHAVAVPPANALGGGETEFADMRAAYDALPETMKAEIDGLVAEHDVFWSRGQIGFTEFPPGEREQYPPSRQRLVRRHPGSQRKTLYLSAHASHIVGWPVPEGRLLLLDLNTHATRPEFVYSHKWRVGDLVIWGNRCTMHRGRPHDDAYPRDLRRATTLDIGSTLDEAA